MILAIQGSRTLTDQRIKEILLKEIDQYNPTTIVTSAEIDGVCKLARIICKEKSIPLKIHFANPKYGRGAYDHRSRAVQNDCDHIIFIHDGESKGTAHEIQLAGKLSKPNTIYCIRKLTTDIMHMDILPYGDLVG